MVLDLYTHGEFLYVQGMTNKHCDKLVKESRVLNWKENPVLGERDRLVNTQGNMACCTKERKILIWPLHRHCEKCHLIRTSVSTLPRFIFIILIYMDLFSIPTLFYALLKLEF